MGLYVVCTLINTLLLVSGEPVGGCADCFTRLPVALVVVAPPGIKLWLLCWATAGYMLGQMVRGNINTGEIT